MYARDVDDLTLTFAVSGKLWNRSLVMIDDQTSSLWSHILGEAKQGNLKGTQLKMLPSTMTDWKTWRADYPHSTVVNLSRTSQEYNRKFYRTPSRFLVGVVDGEKTRAWPFVKLLGVRVVNDEFSDSSLVVFYDPASGTATLFDRRLNESDAEPMSFQWRDHKFTDTETASQWDPHTGRCIEGKLSGQRLRPLVGIVSFRQTWHIFHPDSEYWGD